MDGCWPELGRDAVGFWIRDSTGYQSLAQSNFCLALPIQRHERLFLRSRNQNVSLPNGVDLYFVPTKLYGKTIHGALFKGQCVEACFDARIKT